MSTDIPSIEDLLKKPAAPNGKTGKPAGKLESEKTAPEKFEERMVEIKLKEKETLAVKQAAASHTAYMELRGFAISPEALALIPFETAKETGALAFLYTGPELRIAALDPTNQKVKDLAFQTSERNKTNAEVYQVSEDSFNYALELYKSLPKIVKIIKGVRITDEEITKYQEQMNEFQEVAKLLTDASISNIFVIVISAALKFGTSDIHIEAEEDGIKVRFRVDGVLQTIAELPKERWQKIVARIKLISGLKINITDRPQDGRFTIFLKEGNTDVRVSNLPTTWGESVVMRILKPSAIEVGFEQLGFRPKAFAKLENEMRKPHGMIMTTGPTGSGKTTTLYSMLRKLNQPGVKIITLEDPIEYKLEGINQSQVDSKKDYTFAGGLRSILRQDPDIVMVGEIRDLETADVAVNAALTGHLLLSTIHTNDAAGAIPRMVNMGVKPFLLAQALNVVMGQRLVRRLCETCKKPVELEEKIMKEVLISLEAIPEASGERLENTENLTFHGPVGCDKCNEGYKGRLGIYEILIMSSEIEKFVREGSITESQMLEVAQQQGMTTMYQDGLLKVLEGITSVEEINRVALT